jgi:copper transport protein
MMGSPVADLLGGANAVVLYSGFMLLAGTLSFWVLVWAEGPFERLQLLLVDVGLLVVAVTTVLGPVISLVTSDGGPLESISREEAASAVLRLAVLAATTAWLPELVDGGLGGRRRLAATAIVVSLAATMVASSDAITGHFVGLKIVVALGHLLAAAAWLGGLVALAVVVMSSEHLGELDELVPAFSKVAFVSVVTLVVTGGLHALWQAGGFAALASSSYGLVLLVKVVVFAGMIGLGNVARRHANGVVLRRLRVDGVGDGGVRTLAVVIGAELATAGAVLITTGVLVAMAPLG